MKNSYVEIELCELGSRELQEVAAMFEAYAKDGLPISSEGLKIGFNKNSGYVFFTNEDFEVCMLSDGKLVRWLTCCNCGDENFEGDIILDDCGECEACRK